MTKEMRNVLIAAGVFGGLTAATYAASKKAVAGNVTAGEVVGAAATGAVNGFVSGCTVIGATKLIKDNFFNDEEIELF